MDLGRSAATNASVLQRENACQPWQRDLQVQEFSLGPFERNLSIEKLSLRAKGKSPRLVSDRAVHRSAATNTSVLQREDASQPWMNSASGRGKETCRSRISFLGPWGRDLPIEDLSQRANRSRNFRSGLGPCQHCNDGRFRRFRPRQASRIAQIRSKPSFGRISHFALAHSHPTSNNPTGANRPSVPKGSLRDTSSTSFHTGSLMSSLQVVSPIYT